jgi:16S rRNA (cytidine1402-2'-O)-methyltransferase
VAGACEDAVVTGRIVLAATPIGDPDDASPRLRQALADADVVAAEDTRRLRRLCAALSVSPRGRIVSYHEHNEGPRTRDLVSAAEDGAVVVLVTDAGMPSVSDPGFRLVAAAIDAGVPVTALPGPSALTTALVVSGLPVDRFCFEGFLPRKGGQRRNRLADLVAEPRTMVFFEAPHRLADVLSDLAAAFGPDRAAAVTRELTKTYEEVRRGSLAELAEWAAAGVRGEITLVVAGAPAADERHTDDDLARAVRDELGAGASRKDAVSTVAARTGVARRRVYDVAITSTLSSATGPSSRSRAVDDD